MATAWWLAEHGPWVWKLFVAAACLGGAGVPVWLGRRRARRAARIARRNLLPPRPIDEAAEGVEASVRGIARLEGGARFDMRAPPARLVIDVGGRQVEAIGPFVIVCGSRERWARGV